MKTLIFISFIFLCLKVNGQNNSTKTKSGVVSTDTVYIPSDLNDCLKQLDKMYADSIKTRIKAMNEDEFSGLYHHGFGMWMRNNWGLWKGSKLSKYFNSIGIYHPDDMTGIIFVSYHRTLLGTDVKLDEQVKFYQNYWEKVKKNELQRQKTAMAEFSNGDTVLFSYGNGFASKTQEKKYDKDECIAKGIIREKNDTEFLLKVRLIEACDKMGIVTYDNKGTLVLNKTTKKLEKLKKRVIKYMKPGQELWFYYSQWEISD